MPTVNPYLGFDGDCEEAFGFYRSVFGGEFEAINRYSEMPPDAQATGSDADKIMHISLPLGDGQALMGSDRPPGMGSTTFGDSVAISISPESGDGPPALRGALDRRPGDHALRAPVLGRRLRHVQGPLRHQLDGQLPAARVTSVTRPGTG